MNQSNALVVLSGGQDSTTCLYWARERYQSVHAVTFDYGQSHAIEIEAARKIAVMAEVASYEVIAVPGLLISTSPLLDRSAILETYTDFESMERIIGDRVELTFVPMRNLLFLTIAANRAAALNCGTIITGICQADGTNYPDCTAHFAATAETAINTANGTDWLRIVTPLMDKGKRETVHLAASLPGCLDALAFSHTCYAGVFPPCGTCHACVLRAHGFAEARVADPLTVRANAPTV